jgi:hypothetical protein
VRLTDATRTRLRVTTIGAIDCNKAARVKRRKERDAAAHRARWKIAARPPSAASSKPWKIEGISRATWYRRQHETVRQIPSAADRSAYSAADAKGLRPDDDPAKAAPAVAAAPRAHAFVIYAEGDEPWYAQPRARSAADAARRFYRGHHEPGRCDRVP